MMLGSQCSPCCVNCCSPNSRWLVPPPSGCGSQLIADIADLSQWPVGTSVSGLVAVSVGGVQETPLVVSRGSTFVSARNYENGVVKPGSTSFQISTNSFESPTAGCAHPRFFYPTPTKSLTLSEFSQNDTLLVLSINVQIESGRYAFATFNAAKTFRDSNGNFIYSQEPAALQIEFGGATVGFEYPSSSSPSSTVYLSVVNQLRATALLQTGGSYFDPKNEPGAYSVIDNAAFTGTFSGSASLSNYPLTSSFSVLMSQDFFLGCNDCNPLP